MIQTHTHNFIAQENIIYILLTYILNKQGISIGKWFWQTYRYATVQRSHTFSIGFTF